MEERNLADALSAKAPYVVASALGKADFTDCLLLKEPEQQHPRATFDGLVKQLQAIAPKTHGK